MIDTVRYGATAVFTAGHLADPCGYSAGSPQESLHEIQSGYVDSGLSALADYLAKKRSLLSVALKPTVFIMMSLQKAAGKQRPFHVWLCCTVLLCFALTKLGTVLGWRIGLLTSSPPSGGTDELLLLGTGLAEMVVVILILRFLAVKRACQLLAFIGVCFLAYRYTLNETYCPCLGAAPTLLPWLKINQQSILLSAPCMLLLLGVWGWAREVNLTPRH